MDIANLSDWVSRSQVLVARVSHACPDPSQISSLGWATAPDRRTAFLSSDSGLGAWLWSPTCMRSSLTLLGFRSWTWFLLQVWKYSRSATSLCTFKTGPGLGLCVLTGLSSDWWLDRCKMTLPQADPVIIVKEAELVFVAFSSLSFFHRSSPIFPSPPTTSILTWTLLVWKTCLRIWGSWALPPLILSGTFVL